MNVEKFKEQLTNAGGTVQEYKSEVGAAVAWENIDLHAETASRQMIEAGDCFGDVINSSFILKRTRKGTDYWREIIIKVEKNEF